MSVSLLFSDVDVFNVVVHFSKSNERWTTATNIFYPVGAETHFLHTQKGLFA